MLISTVETHRFDTENQATRTIEEAKQDGSYILSKYSTEHKERKSKGEVVEEYYKVVLTKVFNDIKEPISDVKVIYEVD